MSKVGLKKGPWTPEEDKKLIAYITQHGLGNWSSLPSRAGLQRSGKSCRLRWINYLKSDIKRGNFSLEEERTIIQLHALLGNKWSIIAAQLPKRTDNEIKNYWNTIIKKKLIKMGIDPITHKPIANKDGVSVINHIAEWESVRLEAEARSSSMLSSTSTRPARLIIRKVPMTQQPLSSSSDSPSTNAMYNMCALMLSTGDDDVLQQQLSFSSSRREVSNNIVGDFTERSLSLSYEGESDSNNNSIRESSGQDNMMVMMMHGYVSNFQDDDDLMVAVQAFTAAAESIPKRNVV